MAKWGLGPKRWVRKIGGRKKELLNLWYPTKIADANHCCMFFYLKYFEKVPLPQIPAFVKGGFLHRHIEHFWERLGTPEEVARDAKIKKKTPYEKKKYYDDEGFADFLQRKWTADVLMPDLQAKLKTGKGTVAWGHDGQGYQIKGLFYWIGKGLFPILVAEGPPLLSELEYRIRFEDFIIQGRMDEVRVRDGKVVIRDFKSGYPWISKEKVKHDPQLTLYNVGLLSLCYDDNEASIEFAKKLGIEATRKQYMGHPRFVNPDWLTEYFMIEAAAKIAQSEEPPPKIEDYSRKRHPQVSFVKDYSSWQARTDRLKANLPPVLHPANRTDEHFWETIAICQNTKKQIEQGIVYAERGEKCGHCQTKEECIRRMENGGEYKIPGHEQQLRLFSMMDPPYQKSISAAETMPSGPMETPPQQKGFAWGRGQNTSKGRYEKK